jgi:serine/threonine-protein kinase SRPK3
MSSTKSSSYNSSSNYSNDYYDDWTGCILNNKYITIYEIGSGAFSTVWLAYNFKNKKYYAIKIQFSDDYDAGLDEVSILEALNKYKCPYLNALIEHFIIKDEFGKNICMVFDLCAGSLYDIMKYGKHSKGLELSIVKKIIKQLLDSIKILCYKEKILHTDIKPENILVEGISNKINIIISEFKKLKIDDLLKKYKNKSNIEKILENKINTINFKKIKDDVINSQNIIDEKFIDQQNLKIKLSDFGNCKNKNHAKYDIQTRYYRAPEILLRYKYNENCDMWSIGCLIYELLTGEILFDPHKKARINTDRDHVHKMVSILGKIPDHLLQKSEKRDTFFREDGLLKNINKIEFTPLHQLVRDKMIQYSQNDINNTIDLLHQLLNYDPFKRLNPNECLNHVWFE